MNENNFVVRYPSLDDVPALVELEKDVWKEEMAASDDKWVSRINTFSKGIGLAEENGYLAGVMVTLIINWDYSAKDYPTWEEISGDGFLQNHDIKGDTMYGIDIAVLSNKPGVAQKLVETAVNDMRARKLKRGIIGSRIPILSKYAEKHRLTDLNQSQVEAIALKDPTVRFFVHNGFTILKARENYFSVDQESLGWGIIMEIV